MSVRVRFAPSPTGFLHVGGLRSALYNYLFAKHQGGKFILRIEDTDRTRLVENAMENLIDSLRWAGIEFDEGPGSEGDFGPYIQSERLDIYTRYSNLLLENGSAYYAFDTPYEIEAMRDRLQKEKKNPKYDRYNMKNSLTLSADEVKKYIDSSAPKVVRLKVPIDKEVRFNDIIRGGVVVHGKEIDDQVLLKSDGFPTYHLANVVDDHLMKISHVIRGEEWLPSTPKHILLYEAFGWDVPVFAHLPLLLNKDKTKLSKRQGDVAVEDYRAKGYIRDAFVNFIALLGWNPTGDRDIFTIDELIDTFSLEKVNKGGAVFDIVKLNWMNSQYLRKTPLDVLADELKPLVELKFNKQLSAEYLENVLKLFIERINILPEVLETASYMFVKPENYEQEYQQKHWKENTKYLINPLIEIYRTETDFSKDNVHDKTMAYVESQNIKLKEIIHPIRLMITGKSAGAGMFETMEVLGKLECIERFELFLSKLS